MIDLCLFPKRILDCCDQILELNRVTLAEIKDVVEGAVIFERGHRPLNHIIDVSVIAPRCAVTELLNRLPCVNAPRELMNRQIWPLAWTVNGKITQCDQTHLIEMRIGRAKKFRSYFCRGIGTQRLSE